MNIVDKISDLYIAINGWQRPHGILTGILVNLDGGSVALELDDLTD